MSQQTFQESDKPRRAYFQQLNEALRTGGVGARIPIIQRAVEGQNVANQAGLQSTSNALARSGLAGTPFGTAALANQTVTGDRATAGIGPSIANAMISGAPPVLTSASGIPGLAAAASLQQQGQLAAGQNAAGYGQAGGSILAALLSNMGSSSSSATASPSTVNVPSYGGTGG